MTPMSLQAELCEELNSIPLLDIHTHLVDGKLAARGLHDILFYHMSVSDLYGAGCPSGARLTQYPGWPTEEEAHQRIQEALPFLKYVTNTSFGERQARAQRNDISLTAGKATQRKVFISVINVDSVVLVKPDLAVLAVCDLGQQALRGLRQHGTHVPGDVTVELSKFVVHARKLVRLSRLAVRQIQQIREAAVLVTQSPHRALRLVERLPRLGACRAS